MALRASRKAVSSEAAAVTPCEVRGDTVTLAYKQYLNTQSKRSERAENLAWYRWEL